MMVPRRRGLIVNVSSAGGLQYLFNVAYGVGKQAVSELVTPGQPVNSTTRTTIQWEISCLK